MGICEITPMKNALHFVSFSDDAYVRAKRVFGPPDFIHRYWDWRAVAEVMEGDTVVFAKASDYDLHKALLKGHVIKFRMGHPVFQYSYDDSAFF
jgi:hypothetical protein